MTDAASSTHLCCDNKLPLMSEPTEGRQDKRREPEVRSFPAAAAAIITDLYAKDADALNSNGSGSSSSTNNNSNNTFTLVFHNPSEFLAVLEPELSLRPKQSNIVYAHAHKLRQYIRAGKRVQPGQYWIALYSSYPTSASPPQQQSRAHSNVSTADLACTSPSQGMGMDMSMGRPRLQFVLSCTTGALGDYPVFIYKHDDDTPSFSSSSSSLSSSSSDFVLRSHMQELASRLHLLVPPSRVFSVFAPHKVTTAFASAWKEVAGVDIVRGPPWYSATSSFCTLETFRGANMLRLNHLSDVPSPLPLPFMQLPVSVPDCEAAVMDGLDGTTSGNGNGNENGEAGWYQLDESRTLHSMRRATLDDLDECATLCREFAETSPPFVLTADRARLEAEELIRSGLLWIYGLTTTTTTTTTTTSLSSHSPELSSPGKEKKKTTITTLVAVTRSTPTVSAITKVYTTNRYRRRGYADRLVAHVTRYLLEEEKKEAVVLFVGHTLDAVRVYRRIGFVGLDRLDGQEVVEKPDPCDGADVEDWLELGFEGGELGHW
ncbi:hypothetical protein FRB91_001937 [Serendipita sp. 411]|nr:hypothetical protein FRB91_001937 [Serendipita sp. 411]